MVNLSSFKTHEAYLEYQRNYRKSHREKLNEYKREYMRLVRAKIPKRMRKVKIVNMVNIKKPRKIKITAETIRDKTINEGKDYQDYLKEAAKKKNADFAYKRASP